MQDAFLPIPGVISCAGVTGSGRILHDVTLMTGLIDTYMYRYMYVYISIHVHVHVC